MNNIKILADSLITTHLLNLKNYHFIEAVTHCPFGGAFIYDKDTTQLILVPFKDKYSLGESAYILSSDTKIEPARSFDLIIESQSYITSVFHASLSLIYSLNEETELLEGCGEVGSCNPHPTLTLTYPN